MPSTNVNVGLHDGRTSSRVLKPPGGGHSDIFGQGTAAQSFLRNKNAAQQSGIGACLFNHEDNSSNGRGTDSNGTTSKLADVTVTSDIIEESNGKTQEVVDAVVQQTEEVKKVVPVAVAATVLPPPKVRVPPGGFSSGFW